MLISVGRKIFRREGDGTMGGGYRKPDAEHEPQDTRVRHTAALRRLEKRRDEVAFEAAPADEPFPVERPDLPLYGRQAGTEAPAAEPREAEPILKVVSRQRALWVVEQTVSHAPASGRPAVEIRLRLSTAVRGSRKENGLTQAAYLLRLELLGRRDGLSVEGFTLGPWRADDLRLETGSIHLAEALWSAFSPRQGKLRGRLRIREAGRNRTWDLPWPTEGLAPGPEPFPA